MMNSYLWDKLLIRIEICGLLAFGAFYPADIPDRIGIRPLVPALFGLHAARRVVRNTADYSGCALMGRAGSGSGVRSPSGTAVRATFMTIASSA